MNDFVARSPTWGEPAPWFAAPTAANPRFQFASIGGRIVVMLFYRSAEDAAARAALDVVRTRRALFDDERACFFGVVATESDVKAGFAADAVPGIRFFHDFGTEVSALFGAADAAGAAVERPGWVVLDARLRVMARAPIEQGTAVLDIVERMLRPAAQDPIERHAPVLILPRVFEPPFCKQLVELYDKTGGEESGFMRDIDGKTRLIKDYTHKRRSDVNIEDQNLQRHCAERIRRRLLPEVKKAFAFNATRIERYIVACYDSESGGYFRPHRDNMTKGTAHRRFAVTINLNAEDYDGGDLRFPEFGRGTYRAPTGGAVVFSCSLLHEATPVTRGKRYAFLPFLYDEDARKIREENLKYVALDNDEKKSAETPAAADS